MHSLSMMCCGFFLGSFFLFSLPKNPINSFRCNHFILTLCTPTLFVSAFNLLVVLFSKLIFENDVGKIQTTTTKKQWDEEKSVEKRSSWVIGDAVVIDFFLLCCRMKLCAHRLLRQRLHGEEEQGANTHTQMHHKRRILSSFPSVILSLHHCLEYHQTKQQVHWCILIQCKSSSSSWTIHDLSFSLRSLLFIPSFILSNCACECASEWVCHYPPYMLFSHPYAVDPSLTYTNTQCSFCQFAERTLHKCWDENRMYQHTKNAYENNNNNNDQTEKCTKKQNGQSSYR